jgi:hypothetical protein
MELNVIKYSTIEQKRIGKSGMERRDMQRNGIPHNTTKQKNTIEQKYINN